MTSPVSTTPADPQLGLPPPPERVGAEAASSTWDGDVIYREMCDRRLWRDHYEPFAEFTGRHHLRETAPVPDVQQDDLTEFDSLVEQTDKVFAADDRLTQPSQDPTWIPASVVDEFGRPV